MDLSKKAKTRRDLVEEPLFRLEKMLDDLDECQTRVNATIAVWPETSRTLKPTIHKQDALRKDLAKLKDELSGLWKQGHASNWK